MFWLAGILFVGLALALAILVLKISSQLNGRLNHIQQSLQEANQMVSANLGHASTLFGNVQQSLGRLEESNKHIYEVGKSIAGLQELLRAPKFRGSMGEMMLENLLAQVLPKEYYQPQFRFKSGEAVDAVIKLGERLVPIDAKFSLENFQKMQEAQDEPAKSALRRKFIQDVKMRVEEIASKYILPDENTYDFALMYIPAENVYYEIIIKEDLFSYLLAKKIIPVSPNTFYAYLQVICLGLKGMKIEENAQEILKNLSGLSVELTKFREDFEVLGTHLANARAKYDEGYRHLDRLADKLDNAQEAKKLTAV